MPTIRLVADPYPPYQYEDGGSIKGTDYDTICQIFRALQFRLEVELHPWDECLRRVNTGAADGVFQTTKTAEREARYLFSDLLRTEETALFARRNNRPILGTSSIASCATGECILGVLDGYSYSSDIDGIPRERKLLVSGQEELLSALNEGRCDVVLMDTGGAAYLSAKLGIVDFCRLNDFALRRDLYVAFRKVCDSVVEAFNHQLAMRQLNQPESIDYN